MKKENNVLHRRFCRLLFLFCMTSVLAGKGIRAEIITIMSANLTSGTDQSYESPGIRIFQGLQPDIILIQEFSYDEGSLEELVDEAFGADYDFFCEPGDETIPNGIVSRYPIIEAGQWTDSYVSDRDFAWAIIDLPGGIDLQAVSVHLKSGDTGVRNQQATLLKSYIETYFDPDQFIVVGGDLNTTTRTEAAVTTLATFLSPMIHIPVDQNGNSNTSEPRTRPYDWVIPNAALDARHVAHEINGQFFPEGLVFDSHVYTPLADVPPIQYQDSHVSGMQHMAVIRAFNTDPQPSPSPTPQITPTPAASPSPTSTSPGDPTFTPSPQPQMTASPTPTPSAACTELGCKIDMPSNRYKAGDLFYLSVDICNPGHSTYTNVPLFVILDIAGNYYFAPEFTEYGYLLINLPPGFKHVGIISALTWPQNAGTADGIVCYAAMTDSVIRHLFGDFDQFEFGWY